MIAALASGSGKTTIARGLMALLTARGYRVQPFKCGPDYIDTKFHEAVCHRPSINLDTAMAPPAHVEAIFERYGKDADICVAEGMMGLYDGYRQASGSSAEIARVLGMPIVLVADAKSTAWSMAPLLWGFVNFWKSLRFVGVIFNRVGSPRHYEMLREACRHVGVACLGYLPKSAALEQGSRYLGLDFSQRAETKELLRLLEEHIDLERLLQGSVRQEPECRQRLRLPKPLAQHLVVARNAEAFSFIYQENLDRYSRVSFFDPERDVPALKAGDLLYLPGGYPEKHLEALTANGAAREAIRRHAEQGGRIVAECGGMMYLCDRIVTDEGAFPMCGVISAGITARKADRKLSLGYRYFELDGVKYRGHEFHYTQFEGQPPASAAQVYDANNRPVATPVIRQQNVLASYTHLYHI